MTITVLIVIAVLVLAVGLFVLRAIPGVRAYFDYRGKRLITCPESHTTEAVEVNAKEAAAGAFLTEPTLRLKEDRRAASHRSRARVAHTGQLNPGMEASPSATAARDLRNAPPGVLELPCHRDLPAAASRTGRRQGTGAEARSIACLGPTAC